MITYEISSLRCLIWIQVKNNLKFQYYKIIILHKSNINHFLLNSRFLLKILMLISDDFNGLNEAVAVIYPKKYIKLSLF